MKKIYFLFLFIFMLPIEILSQDLENFTGRNGLGFATNQAKSIMGDSIKLFEIVSHDGQLPDSYNNNGISRNWCYSFCNNDTCLQFIINKQNDIFLLKDILHYEKSYNNQPFINDFRFDSDSSFLITNCVDRLNQLIVSEYRLIVPENFFNPNWVNILIPKNDTIFGEVHQWSDVHSYIDAINGHCFAFQTIVVEQTTKDEEKLIIYPNPANDYIIINNKHLMNQKNVHIFIYNIYGECVLQYNYPENENINIAVATLKVGVYFIKINNKIYKFSKI